MRVDYNTAVTLKSKGYDVPCMYYMTSNGTEMTPSMPPRNHNRDHYLLSQPTLAEAADWLREKKGLHVYCLQDKHGKWQYMIEEVPRTRKVWHNMNYETYPLSLSSAITKALTILKDRK